MILTPTDRLFAQTDDLPATPLSILDVNVDTNMLTAIVPTTSSLTPAGMSTAQAQVLFTHDLIVPGAPWIRLHFVDVKLSGTREDDNQSFLRITSMKDGAQQTITAMDLIYWGKSSAYFNGDEVLVELLAYPGTGENRIVIDKVLTTELSHDPTCFVLPYFICGSTDDRIPSTEPGVGRMRFTTDSGSQGCINELICTAFLINDQHCGFITAGHCGKQIQKDCIFSSIVEFNVPSVRPGRNV